MGDLNLNWQSTENSDFVSSGDAPVKTVLSYGRLWSEMSTSQKFASLVITSLTAMLLVVGFLT